MADKITEDQLTPEAPRLAAPGGSARNGGGTGNARDHIRQLLREHGLRYSRPREAILEFFDEAGGHVTAESLYLTLKGRNEDVSLSTVYLNLGVLRDAGLIMEFAGTNGESIYDSNVTPHHHVICAETGEVHDVPLIEIDGVPLSRYLRERIEAETGWVIEEPSLGLRGRRRE
jgi:Fe2+ or Zn2+ uptake regulation protein